MKIPAKILLKNLISSLSWIKMSPYENKMIQANYNLVHDRYLIYILMYLNTKDVLNKKEEMREDRKNEGRME